MFLNKDSFLKNCKYLANQTGIIINKTKLKPIEVTLVQKRSYSLAKHFNMSTTYVQVKTKVPKDHWLTNYFGSWVIN